MSTGPRIGLAGDGSGGRYFHAPMLATLARIDFAGVVTTSAERDRHLLPAGQLQQAAGVALVRAEHERSCRPGRVHPKR